MTSICNCAIIADVGTSLPCLKNTTIQSADLATHVNLTIFNT
nr:MAG TPA_asm: hypothetical protein [Caudoviricetes sp.]